MHREAHRSSVRSSAAVFSLALSLSLALGALALPVRIVTVPAAAADLVPVGFSQLPGWRDDDHARALRAFEISCGPLHPSVIEAWLDQAETTRAAPAPRRDGALEPACAALREAGGASAHDGAAARAFFEAWFAPFRVLPENSGHVTAYYEPVLAGSRERTDRFTAPLFALPHDLRPLDPQARPPGFPDHLTAARLTPAGPEPYPDRAALSDPRNWEGLEPLAWVEDPVDAYFIHIQGSVRLELRDGTSLRLGYAGKNGHPYRSAGRAMIERGIVPSAGMTAEAMKAWLKQNPDQAKAILAVNPSFVFFREIGAWARTRAPSAPRGCRSVPAAVLRSIRATSAMEPRSTSMPRCRPARPWAPKGSPG